ncbi:MAG: AIR synthase related protein [Bacteroidia bacterium]
MSETSDWYRALGVSAHKPYLQPFHTATYFAKPLPDLAGSETYRFFLHADGVGTKGILSYLWWKESQDPLVWAHLAQDALVMNTDDLACAGVVEGFVFSTTIQRNPFHIPDEVVQAIIEGVYAFVAQLNQWGVRAEVAGGETADMPDVVRTIALEAVAAARVRLDQLIPIRRPDRRVYIVGLASFGQASYETSYNSGIGCNGLTAARHLLLKAEYAKQYPETVAPELPTPYQGDLRLSDTLEGHAVGALLTAPTRTYLPILRDIYRECRSAIYAVIHCTGGGQRKALKYLPYTLIAKTNFFPLPPIFAALQGRRPIEALFEVFNMGHRLELYVLPEAVASVQAIAQGYNVESRLIGEAYPIETPSRLIGEFAGRRWEWASP